jgi:hypothetical protein
LRPYIQAGVIMQDLNDKATGDSLTATEWDQLPSEVQNVIEALGITLSSGDLNQLGKAIAGYVANGIFYTDSGAADAYVLSQVGSKQGPTAYTDGMRVSFLVTHTNTGASTVNVSGIGVADIVDKADAALGAGVLLTGQIVELYYSASYSAFVLLGARAMDMSSESLPFTFSSDANQTLTAIENLFGQIAISGSVLSAGRNLVVSNVPRLISVTNGESYTVTVKTAAGTGIPVAAGTSQIVACDGTNVIDPMTAVTSDGEYRSVQVITASGTWNKPAGLKRIKVTVVGGGAGGSTNASNSRGGGGAGGASIKTIEAASLGATESVTVGAGGAAGSAGGTSSFGAHCSATGGAALGTTLSNGGLPGVGSGGDLNLSGGGGDLSSTGGHCAQGGSSYFGGGGAGLVNPASYIGDAGRAAGSGGGGGAAGWTGVVIVEEFF